MKKLFFNVTLALVLASIMMSTVVAPALAEEPEEPTGPRVTATIEKELIAPEGTVLPAGLTFTFSFAQVYGPTVTPAIPDATLDMTRTGVDVRTANGIITFSDETANLLEGVTFPTGGMYIFEVTERDTVTPPVDGTMTFDSRSWLLFVQVANRDAGTEIHTVIMGRPRVDAESGAPILDELGRPTAEAKDSGSMLFENMFIPTDIGTIDDPEDTALVISKTVTGELANMLLPFSFSLNLTAPALPVGTTLEGPIWATIVDTRGTTDVTVGNPIDILENPNFTLPHGHELRVATLPVGAGFTVTETGTPEYVPSAIVVAGSATGNYTREIGQGLTTGSYRISMEEAGNSAAFTNAHQAIEIMGLVIASMPFITALVLSTALLAMMVATRSRKRIESLPIAH